MLSLLIADKDSAAYNIIASNFDKSDIRIDRAADGIGALKLFRKRYYDIVILDWQLSLPDSKSVFRQIKKMSSSPVIVLDENGTEVSMTEAFDMGAEDYLRKPYVGAELAARLKLAAKRIEGAPIVQHARLVFGRMMIDLKTRTVYIDDRTVTLTLKEYEILALLAQKPDIVFSREMIIKEVWHDEFFGSDRTVDTHIKMLRGDLKPCSDYIATVWGVGYRFNPDAV